MLVDASPESAPRIARQMSRRGVSASFALEGAPTQTTLAVLRGLGDEALPKLGSGGPFHSLETRDRLSHAAVALGLGRNFLYEPDRDFSIGQYLLAHAAGGSPVRGATQVNPGDQVGDLAPRRDRGDERQPREPGLARRRSTHWTAGSRAGVSRA